MSRRPPDPSTRRILIAEDETATRRALRELLVNEGYRVIAVPDGRAALRIIERESFDFAILDISMPGLTGWQVAERVRERRRERRPILVALTSLNRRQDRERSRAAGFAAHLAKPIGFRQLRELLERLESG